MRKPTVCGAKHADPASLRRERNVRRMRSSGCSRARGPRAGRTDLVFVYDLDAYARGHAHPGEVAQILGGGPLPVSIARRLAVDAFVKVVLHDGTKVDTVIHYGRRRPTLLQTILDLGEPPDFDGVACADEGCDRRFGLQWDHVDPAAHDGPCQLREPPTALLSAPPGEDRTRPSRRACSTATEHASGTGRNAARRDALRSVAREDALERVE